MSAQIIKNYREGRNQKMGGHEFNKWCYTEVRAYHITLLIEDIVTLWDVFDHISLNNCSIFKI